MPQPSRESRTLRLVLIRPLHGCKAMLNSARDEDRVPVQNSEGF